MHLIPVWSTQAPDLLEYALQAPAEEWPRLVADPARAPLEDVAVDVVAEAAEVEEAVVAAAVSFLVSFLSQPVWCSLSLGGGCGGGGGA